MLNEVKNEMKNLIVIFITTILLTACATTYIGPEDARDSIPKERFSAFDHVYMKHVTLEPSYQESSANQAALKKIDENLFKEMGLAFPKLKELKTGESINETTGRTLVIEPHVEKIKFISAGARVWAGALAGSSAVVLKVTYRELATDKIIAEPGFYQRASAMGGSWSFGAHDNSMLFRIAQIAATHVRENY